MNAASEHTIEFPPGGPLRLGGSLDVYTAAELRDGMARALGEGADLSVDLSAVTSCDFTTVQVLCSARRTAEESGKQFAVTAVSEAVVEACAALGLSPGAFGAVREE